MKIPTTEAEWIKSIDANRSDLARAYTVGDQAAIERLRVEYDQLQACRDRLN